MLQIELVPITAIRPYENNAKIHTPEQIEQIKNSILEFGNNDPIAIDASGVIIEGHGRLMALKELGYKEVEVIRLGHLTEEQRKAYTLIHNKLTMNTDFDLDLLALELESIENINMADYDFELDIKDEEGFTEVDEDNYDVEPPKEPRAKRGQIYQLGRHRVMCGSSTDAKDIKRLMAGETARMLFTSPPYSDMREYEGGKDLAVEKIATFIEKYRDYTDYQCVNLGLQRKNHEIYPYWDEYIEIARNCGYKLLAWNVWDKLMCGSIGQQNAFFPLRHEWIFVFGTEFFEINQTWAKKEESIREGRHRPVRQADGSMTMTHTGDMTNKFKQMESVLPMLSELGSIRSLHPATFPVGLPSEYIQAMSDKGDIIIEPFCGSGTTVLACEQLDRRCFAMELEPTYVDVIIDRWEQFTGQKAKLLTE